jgi:hypothetical protein
LIPDGFIPAAADRIPATQRIKLKGYIPVLLLFYTLAVLVQLRNTRVLRLSILLAMGMLAWRFSTRYNFDGSDEPGYNLSSMTVCVSQFLTLSLVPDLTNAVVTAVVYVFPDAPRH